MIKTFRSNIWPPLLPPLLLFAALVTILFPANNETIWLKHHILNYLPYIIFSLVSIFGIFFGHTRALYVSLLCASITVFIHTALSDGGIMEMDASTLTTLAAIYIPPLALLFYHLPERSVFSIQGLVNLIIIASVAVAIVLFARGNIFEKQIPSQTSWILNPVSRWLPMPRFGLINILACGPFILIPKKHESPLLGAFFCLGLIFMTASLNHNSAFFNPVIEKSAFLMFATGSQLCLLWGILESLWRNAHTDELTELPGRRLLRKHMSQTRLPYAIAVADIDHFKKINDTHGHNIGDQVLRFVASRLSQACAGKVYRYGGEEFVAIYEHIEKKDAALAADELRQTVAGRPFFLRGKDRPRKKPQTAKKSSAKSIKVTVSIGIAHNDDPGITAYEVFDKADKAMYRAKKAGRNKVKAG